MESQTLAAWVQAIGSIATIIGAYFLGERQGSIALRNSRLLAKDAEQIKRDSILEIARMAVDRATEIGALFADQPIDTARMAANYHPSILESRATALSSIPVLEVGSAEAAAALLDIRDQLVFLKNAVQQWSDGKSKSGNPGSGDRLQWDAVWCTNVRTHITCIERHFESLKAALQS
jgi:hypothetical protein